MFLCFVFFLNTLDVEKTIFNHIQRGKKLLESTILSIIRTMMTQSFWFLVKQTLKGGQCWPVVPDVLEQVEGFLKSVGLIVFSDHHVIATARYHEDDGRHICTKTNASNLQQRRPYFIIQRSGCYWCFQILWINYHWNTGSISDVRPAGRQHRTYWKREKIKQWTVDI